jgi:alpha-L-arabinofuranosidase
MILRRYIGRLRTVPALGCSRPRIAKRQTARLWLELLEDRVVPSTDTWISRLSGSWNTASNWSTGAIPNASNDVIIAQSGNITVTLSGSASVKSLMITGDSLKLTGGTLAVAGSLSSNSGSITIQPGAKLNLSGNFTQTAGGSLTLSPGSLSTGVGTNLLTNPGFESPTATNNTTLPNGWSTWGTPYLSTLYAQAGKQSLQTSGPNTGVLQSFAVSPGVSYTGMVDAMTPASDPLTGPEGAFLQVLFYDASGKQISPYSPPNSVTILTSQSKPGGPLKGSVGNQGWNSFSTTAVAPANAATADFILETGAYTGMPGTAGGEVIWDNAAFGATAVSSASLLAANVSNSGTITIGVGDTIQAHGSFTQTSTGTLAFPLGGRPGSGLYGNLTATGFATLAGALRVNLTNGYSPSVPDGFGLLNYAGVSGTFGTFQLPSGTSYSFQAAVNPTYTAIGAVPNPLAATVNAASVVAPISTTQLGVNLTWWDNQLTTSQTRQMVSAAGLAAFRFPGGSSSDDFHFNVAANSGDPAAITIPQFAQFIQAVGGTGLVTLDYGSGSPQEAAAELAYLEGSPTDKTVIGNGLEWSDSANAWRTVNWQTVGYWASLRAATPLSVDDGYNFLRIGHAASFSNITYWEVGNEEYGSWEIDHHGTAGPGGVSTGTQHDPATYAAFAHTFANYAAEIDPHILIGIDSGDPTGASDNNWTSNVLKHGLAGGFVPGFISDHSYMQAPGNESDSFLLQDTVTDPSSVLDWATRYSDYESMLKTDLGSQASKVRVMATEFNSVYANPGKQSTSLVNGLFIADSIGSLLGSGYTGGFVWDLRNGWSSSGENNSASLYGWRQGGDYGLLGDPNTNQPPSTGAYVPYPSYFAEQLASKMVQAGGTVVSASSNFSGLDVFAVKESNGHLDLLVINKDPDAQITEPFTIQGFSPSGQAQVWQYSEVQDYAQSKSATGASALANSSVTLTLSGSNFSYSFPAYSMTVIDLSPKAASAPLVHLAAVPTSTPPPTLSSTSGSNLSNQVQPFPQDTVLTAQTLISGNLAAFLQTILDYETMVTTLEQQIVQFIFIDLHLP